MSTDKLSDVVINSGLEEFEKADCRQVQFVDLPITVKRVDVMNDDGTVDVYINNATGSCEVTA